MGWSVKKSTCVSDLDNWMGVPAVDPAGNRNTVDGPGLGDTWWVQVGHLEFVIPLRHLGGSV